MTLLDQFLKPCGYSSDDSGNVGAAIVLSGILGAAIVGIAMDSLHWYRTTLKSTIVVSVIVIVITCYVLQKDNIKLIYVVFGILELVLSHSTSCQCGERFGMYVSLQ